MQWPIQLSQVNLHQHKWKWSKVTKSSHCPSPTHSKSYCAVPLPYCVFVGMFRPLEFSFFLFLKAGAPIKACMNRQQCGRTETAGRKPAGCSELVLYALHFVCWSVSQPQPRDWPGLSQKYIQKCAHIFRYKGYAPCRTESRI